MFKYLQEQVQPSVRIFLMAAILALTVLAAWLYLFKKPLKAYQQAGQTLEMLQNEVTTGISLPEQLGNTQQSIKTLQQQLYGLAPTLPPHQKIAFVIGQLGALSGNHKVTLNSIKPGEVNPVFMFQELPFSIEISGTYFSLFAWLQQVEQELGPITVKDFDLQPELLGDKVRMKLTLVSYLFSDKDKL